MLCSTCYWQAHVEIVKRLSHRNMEEYRRHILDSVRQLTKQWWSHLQQGDEYNSMGEHWRCMVGDPRFEL